MYQLPETEIVKVTTQHASRGAAEIVIEPLLPGFGVTIGNALRRVLLSSLGGAAITTVRFEDATHEFSTIKGVREDIVNIILNLKGVRLKLEGEEGVTLTLSKKTPGPVKVSDFTPNARSEFVDRDFVICNLEKGGAINLEVTVEHGRGYVPTEKRVDEKLPIGVIAIDSIFTPIRKVHYEVENTRVEGMTNFDRLTLTLETDQTIPPINAVKAAITILGDHLEHIQSQVTEPAAPKRSERKLSPKKEKAPASDKKKGKVASDA